MCMSVFLSVCLLFADGGGTVVVFMNEAEHVLPLLRKRPSLPALVSYCPMRHTDINSPPFPSRTSP